MVIELYGHLEKHLHMFSYKLQVLVHILSFFVAWTVYE